jgi:hypothetical protein
MTMNRIVLSRCVGLVELFFTSWSFGSTAVARKPAVRFLLLCQLRHIVQRFTQVPPLDLGEKSLATPHKVGFGQPDLLADLEF